MYIITIFLIFNVFLYFNNFVIVDCNNTDESHHEEFAIQSRYRTRAGPGTPYPRIHNLILYSIKGDIANDERKLFSHVYHLFKDICEVKLDATDIHLVRYLKKRSFTGSTKKPAPVLVAFGNLSIKNEILYNRKRLRRTGVIIEHDLPKEVIDAQNNILKPLMDKYRREGKYVLIRNGKLIVDGKKVTEIDMPDRMTYDPFSEERYEKLKLKKYFESLKMTTVKYSDSSATETPINEPNT